MRRVHTRLTGGDSMEQAIGGRQSRPTSYTDSNTARFIDSLSIENVGGMFLIFLGILRYMSYGNMHSYNELITNTMINNMLNLFCYFLKILFSHIVSQHKLPNIKRKNKSHIYKI